MVSGPSAPDGIFSQSVNWRLFAAAQPGARLLPTSHPLWDSWTPGNFYWEDAGQRSTFCSFFRLALGSWATELSSCLATEPQGDLCCSKRICLREWLEPLNNHHLDMELLPPRRNKLNIPDAWLLSTGKTQSRSSDGSSQPRNWACISYVSYIGSGFFTSSATWEAQGIEMYFCLWNI